MCRLSFVRICTRLLLAGSTPYVTDLKFICMAIGGPDNDAICAVNEKLVPGEGLAPINKESGLMVPRSENWIDLISSVDQTDDFLS